MSFLTAFNISANGMSAERLRINVISSNIANINTTRTPEGGPYRRKDVIFEATPINDENSFEKQLKLETVKVKDIVEDSRPPILKYDPSHPDADKDGYVKMPNINIMEEMVNLINASRSYEANVQVMRSAKDMITRTIDILRV